MTSVRRSLPGGIELDDDPARVDVDAVHRFLSTDAYWARGRPLDLFWDAASWAFRGWYVNLQEPLRRTAVGHDMRDQALDIVIAPDGSWSLGGLALRTGLAAARAAARLGRALTPFRASTTGERAARRGTGERSDTAS